MGQVVQQESFPEIQGMIAKFYSTLNQLTGLAEAILGFIRLWTRYVSVRLYGFSTNTQVLHDE